MRNRPLAFTALLTASLITSPAWSQVSAQTEARPTTAPVATEPAEPAIIIVGAEPTENVATKNTSSSGNDTLSVDFPDEDVRNILRNVADLFELNLVVPDTLQGRTSIKLRDVSWRQIFQVVLAPVGFTYVEDGNIIKVVSNDSLAMEPVATEVFILNYARAGDIMPTLSSLVDPAVGGKIVVDDRSNALVITERPSKMNRIRPIIESLDKATAQVMIETKFVEVTNSDIKNIGVNWASLSGLQLGVGNLRQNFDRSRRQTFSNGRDTSNGVTNGTDNKTVNTNTTINGTSSNTTNGTINDTTTTRDFPTTGNGTKTVNTGAITTSVTTTNTPPGTSGTLTIGNAPTTQTNSSSTANSNSFGGTTSLTNSGTIGSTSIGSTITNGITDNTSSAINDLISLANTSGTARVASAVFSASDFNLIISALKQQNDTKLVSNPTIVTLNNSEAQINIGQEFPIPNYTYNQERGTFEVSGFDYRPIGILLKVTPQVNSRGFIRLTIEPEVSSQSGTTSFGGAGGANIPIISTRKTKTQVSLKDGYTMGIGGLIENVTSNGSTKVPVLGSIPLLGRLFRSDSKNVTQRNLIIFITARTVSADGAAIEEVFDSRAVRQLNLRHDELPGYRDGSDPFLPADPNGN